jgi:CheY-like chemotaxis protein
MSNGDEAPTKRQPNATATSITSIADALYSLVKLAIILLVIFVAFVNRGLIGPYMAEWLDTITHVEASTHGLSLDRQASAEKAIDQISLRNDADPTSPRLNAAYARGAIARASRNAAAIAGARILWVDGHPENNKLEEGIFSDMGIDVRRALTTKEALTLIPDFAPDIIISNIVRSGDEQLPLQNCPAHYFEVPSGVATDLTQLNTDTMAGTGKATGFGMAEVISQRFPYYTDHAQPRIIFYSGSSGGVVANQCSRITTNRVDILLQNVVSALEEFRWPKLL